jgi:hypothetical protein
MGAFEATANFLLMTLFASHFIYGPDTVRVLLEPLVR